MILGFCAGYVGQNARLNAMPSGDLVCNWSLGVSTGTKDNPTTEWVDCSMWGQRAEKLHTHIIKGTPMAVSGAIGKRQYTGKDGTPKAIITCRVDKLTFMGGKGDRDEAPAPAAAARPPAADEEIPF